MLFSSIPSNLQHQDFVFRMIQHGPKAHRLPEMKVSIPRRCHTDVAARKFFNPSMYQYLRSKTAVYDNEMRPVNLSFIFYLISKNGVIR